MADIEPMSFRSARVSQNAIYALIAAGLMLYFGYPPSSWSVPQSSPAIYRIAAWTFVYTLVIGGIVMGITALLLFTGWIYALAVDAIISGLIGILLIGCGLVMALNEDTSKFLYVIFGVMFGASAKSAWTDFRALRAAKPAPPDGSELL